ncbi:MAG: hypothetical protein Q4B68_06050 [Bacteroidales bacterium]|nr:hypothetical protein [Bacteroidales bacterium]
MKILFSPNDKLINKTQSEKWGVDEIVLPSEIDDYKLPEEKNFILFIPTILNEDLALNYEGVEIALSLYCQLLRRNTTISAKIVLLGIESVSSFMLKCKYPKIIRCSGFDYRILNIHSVSQYKEEPEPINTETALKHLKEIGLTLPESYKTNHSFVNEWSYYVWSEYMNYDNTDVKNVFKNNIYFDYLQTLYRNQKTKNITEEQANKIGQLKGTVLLIDDSKYWHCFFEKFFRDTNVRFEHIGSDFKHHNTKEILQTCIEKIKESKPDIILLDFRLNEDRDYDVKNFADISGVKVLKALKGKQKNDPSLQHNMMGARVIMFTATGKIKNVLKLKEHGADGFVFKEHPEKYFGKTTTHENIKSMIGTLGRMLECAFIAKPICEHLGKWEEVVITAKTDDRVTDRIKHVCSIVRRLSQGDFLTETDLKLLYLECYSVLEAFKEGNENIDHVIKKIIVNDNFNVDIRLLWDNINKVRTALAHGDNKVELTSPKRVYNSSEEKILSEWLLKLCMFVSETLKVHFAKSKD